jgi:hypothetical protein
LARGTDKGPPGAVFIRPWCLANQHKAGIGDSFAKDQIGRGFLER